MRLMISNGDSFDMFGIIVWIISLSFSFLYAHLSEEFIREITHLLLVIFVTSEV